MKTHNAQNERIKRAYFAYLREAKRNTEQTIDAAAAALHQFETYTRFRDFRSFRIEQAIGFKNHLAKQQSGKTKAPLSKATLLHILAALRAFFSWLAGQPGFRSRISYSDADYFNLSAKDTAVAKADRDLTGPTIEQVRIVLAAMPSETDVEKRNRALIALALLTGARDNALASLRLKHIDLREGKIVQDARDVRTKASKTITTYFFPVGDDFRTVVEEWVIFLQRDRQWGLGDPLFPATRIIVGESKRFEAAGLDRKCWSNATPIRKIFQHAFSAVGLPYFNPHSFRKTLARLGEQTCSTPEEFKAWSQNLGHEKVLTTLTSYGQVDRTRQGELIRKLSAPKLDDAHLIEIGRAVLAASGMASASVAVVGPKNMSSA